MIFPGLDFLSHQLWALSGFSTSSKINRLNPGEDLQKFPLKQGSVRRRKTTKIQAWEEYEKIPNLHSYSEVTLT